MRKSSERLQSVTLADPQFSRRPLGNNAPSKGPPPHFFCFCSLGCDGLSACVCAPASSRGRSRAARETGKRDQIAPSFGFCEREKGRGGRREGPKKSVHEIASDRGLVGKRRNQREPWSARLRDRRGDDVERQQHGAWGRKKGQRRRGSSHTLHRPPPPLFWALLHSTLPASPPAAQQQPTGGGRRWGFLLAAVDSFLWASVFVESHNWHRHV